MTRKEIQAFTVEDIERMIKELGKAEYKIELLTEERDKYKLLYEEAVSGAKSGHLGASAQKVPASPSGPSKASSELVERVKLLEDYVLQLDWPEVPPPAGLADLFSKSQGRLTAEEYEYTGEMIRGSPAGSGKKKFTNGDVSEGPQVDGWSHGSTRFTSAAEGYVQECLCRHGTPEGYFVRNYSSGDREVGCFHEGDWEGVVLQEKKNGETYFRCYKKGLEHGKVVHIWPEKKVVRVCEFKDGAVASQVSLYKFSHAE